MTGQMAQFGAMGGDKELQMIAGPYAQKYLAQTILARESTLYEFKIDTNGDAWADIAYRVRFFHTRKASNGAIVQDYTVKRATGADARANRWNGTIVDTGRTLHFLVELLSTRKPKSIKTCALVRKPDRVEVDMDVDYLGFEIPDAWVVGYGLDYDEQNRTLPHIAAMKPKE